MNHPLFLKSEWKESNLNEAYTHFFEPVCAVVLTATSFSLYLIENAQKTHRETSGILPEKERSLLRLRFTQEIAYGSEYSFFSLVPTASRNEFCFRWGGGDTK